VSGHAQFGEDRSRVQPFGVFDRRDDVGSEGAIGDAATADVADATFDEVFLGEYPGLVRLATVICGHVHVAEEVVRTPSWRPTRAGRPSIGPAPTCTGAS
jgi:hypothetical protein